MKTEKNYPDPDMQMNDINDVVSSTECTGMVRSLPLEEESMENYQDIYDIPNQPGLSKLEKELKNK